MWRGAATALVGLSLVVPAANARTTAFDRVLRDYRVDAVITPCRHSLRDLRVALHKVPPSIEEYAPDFPRAIRAAIVHRRVGGCR